MAKALTAVAVENARAKGAAREIPDGGCVGLYLIVRPTGSKTWAARYRFRGTPRKLTLGPALIGEVEPADVAPEIGTPLSLAAARELATRALRQVMGGTDPAMVQRQKHEAKRAAEADTLEAVAREFLRREGAGLRTLDQRRADLELLYEPLGQLPIEQIKRGQFVRVLDRIADTRGPVRSDRVLNAAKRLLNWHAGRSDYASVLTRAVKRRTSISERARDRVLSDDELRKVWLAAEKFPPPFGPYIRLTLLTACRRNETGGMRRSELLAPDTWVIPRARYKTGRKAKVDMLIPLSQAAQAIVEAQPAGEYVFGRDKPLGNFARRKAELDKACGVKDWRLHDLRRTARTLLSAAHDADGVRITPDIGERCLGHNLGAIRGTYDIHDYELEKRAAFEALARKIELTVRPPPAAAEPPPAAAAIDLASERKRRLRRKA
jgi:integrase